MSGLIEALTILMKYGNPEYPTHCEHDSLYVAINPELVSPADLARLEELSFHPNEDFGGFLSYNYGAC